MVNRWMAHVKEVSAGNPGKSLKEILKMAKKTYKKMRKLVRHFHTGNQKKLMKINLKDLVKFLLF